MKTSELRKIIKEEIGNILSENEVVGDISKLSKIIKINKIKDNWVLAKDNTGKYEVQLKLFSEPSHYGIRNGRISKLWIKDKKGTKLGADAHYDRGWDVEPTTGEVAKLINDIINSVKR